MITTFQHSGAKTGQLVRQCEGGETQAAIKCPVAKIGHGVGEREGADPNAASERTAAYASQIFGECEGGEASALPERILANAAKGLRECEGGETTARIEHSGFNCLHPLRHYDADRIVTAPSDPASDHRFAFNDQCGLAGLRVTVHRADGRTGLECPYTTNGGRMVLLCV